MKAFDFLGKELAVHDEVIFMSVNYRNLVKGKITKITPKKVAISYKSSNNYENSVYQFHSQAVKI